MVRDQPPRPVPRRRDQASCHQARHDDVVWRCRVPRGGQAVGRGWDEDAQGDGDPFHGRCGPRLCPRHDPAPPGRGGHVRHAPRAPVVQRAAVQQQPRPRGRHGALLRAREEGAGARARRDARVARSARCGGGRGGVRFGRDGAGGGHGARGPRGARGRRRRIWVRQHERGVVQALHPRQQQDARRHGRQARVPAQRRLCPLHDPAPRRGRGDVRHPGRDHGRHPHPRHVPDGPVRQHHARAARRDRLHAPVAGRKGHGRVGNLPGLRCANAHTAAAAVRGQYRSAETKQPPNGGGGVSCFC